jgi:hypothetical protein
MSYIHNPHYDDESLHVKIKPKQLLKIPYNLYHHGLAPLDEYIRMSPALAHLKEHGCLVSMTYNTHTFFYTDCSYCMEKINKTWSDNMMFCNLVLFEDIMTALSKEDEAEEAPVTKPKTKLRVLLDELHNEEPKKPAPSHDSKQRAADILKLIRKRQDDDDK